MPNPVELYALAHEALTVAETAIQSVLPADLHHQRVHVSNGPPALDGWVEAQGCVEHLVAWIESVVPTTEGQFPQPVTTEMLACHEKIAAVTIVVQVIRCEPTIEVEGDGPMARAVFPDAQQLDDAARLVLVESWAVWQGLERWARIEAQADVERPLITMSQGPVQPQGGVAGTETRATVATLPDCPQGPADAPLSWAPPLPEDFLPGNP